MLVKFKAKKMKKYVGFDGSGNQITLEKGDTAEVTDMVGNMLKQKHRAEFDIVKEKPAHAPKSDKLYRKSTQTKTK